MRYGLLADVHGNAQALEAALEELERRRVDAYVVAGDLVGYGAQPDECVRIIASLGAVAVAGNHDLIVLGHLPDSRCIPLARDSLRWTRRVLSDESRAFLASLPLRAETADGVVVAHGSLDDPEEYVDHPVQARAQLERLRRGHPGARVLVLGHTHRARAFGPVADGGPLLVNPGAVGQSREVRARARCAVLDTGSGTATLLAMPYDVEGCRDALRAAGLPARSHHLRPSPARMAARSLRDALRGATAGRLLA